MRTLHRYILRELLKTFVLSLAALTVVFTLGGGLYQIVKFEAISAADMVRFVPTLVPIVMTLMMPMAAIFSTTMVYGRLAADNELTACRAAGIHVHRLFFGALVIALGVGLFTLFFGNFVVPRLTKQLEDFARANMREIVAQGLQNRGYFQRTQGDRLYALTAERVVKTDPEALREKGYEVAPGLSYLAVRNPTFLVARSDGAVERFATATYGLCRFDTREPDIFLTIYLVDGRDFEIGRSAATLDQQQIGPWRFPLRLPRRVSTADLATLLEWRAAPWKFERLEALCEEFRLGLTLQSYYQAAVAELARGGALRLEDPQGRSYEIRGKSARLRERGLALEDAIVLVKRAGESRATRYLAPRCDVIAHPLRGAAPVEIRLEERDGRRVQEFNPRAANPDRASEKNKLSLDGPQLPASALEALAEFPPAKVLDETADLPESARAAEPERRQFWNDRRVSLLREARDLRRKITGTIHFRLGFTSSILFTVLLGAALGVMFRGARALAAFGLTTVPFFSVLIVMSLAKQITENEATTLIGPYVTWGGLALLLAGALLTVRLGVAR